MYRIGISFAQSRIFSKSDVIWAFSHGQALKFVASLLMPSDQTSEEHHLSVVDSIGILWSRELVHDTNIDRYQFVWNSRQLPVLLHARVSSFTPLVTGGLLFEYLV